ncbi:MAG: hypothetical protein V4700_00260 [Pseudomonadota bacterium]
MYQPSVSDTTTRKPLYLFHLKDDDNDRYFFIFLENYLVNILIKESVNNHWQALRTGCVRFLNDRGLDIQLKEEASPYREIKAWPEGQQSSIVLFNGPERLLTRLDQDSYDYASIGLSSDYYPIAPAQISHINEATYKFEEMMSDLSAFLYEKHRIYIFNELGAYSNRLECTLLFLAGITQVPKVTFLYQNENEAEADHFFMHLKLPTDSVKKMVATLNSKFHINFCQYMRPELENMETISFSLAAIKNQMDLIKANMGSLLEKDWQCASELRRMANVFHSSSEEDDISEQAKAKRALTKELMDFSISLSPPCCNLSERWKYSDMLRRKIAYLESTQTADENKAFKSDKKAIKDIQKTLGLSQPTVDRHSLNQGFHFHRRIPVDSLPSCNTEMGIATTAGSSRRTLISMRKLPQASNCRWPTKLSKSIHILPRPNESDEDNTQPTSSRFMLQK